MSAAESNNTRVRRVIADAQRLPLERVLPECTLAELGIDSLDALNLVFALEDEFDVSIPIKAGQAFVTVEDVMQGMSVLLTADPASRPAPSVEGAA